ncbi:uncharacterized protein RHIMIDRAFT_113451 [Rhizopus microsporus ATCC 52813]|uniref:C2H2-type domain-containing protein n=1 Tax=Rhizopus microsporus ATCC 52813 TaxID=1340429 RepID=A0A2G4SZ55_RHIZD|nr:uncharacterized protein RHIMIDRAFT_113451 [Rhizopus microsporus ATCC 52813]PHZ14037.1 hypothetical protein RHIMIDRAFT_113451 [Rhizopus microsporus ATCC 52813]
MTAQLITLVNNCFVCNDAFSTPQRLRYHLQALHDITVPPRKTGLKYKRTDNITFVTMDRGLNMTMSNNNLPVLLAYFTVSRKAI